MSIILIPLQNISVFFILSMTSKQQRAKSKIAESKSERISYWLLTKKRSLKDFNFYTLNLLAKFMRLFLWAKYRHSLENQSKRLSCGFWVTSEVAILRPKLTALPRLSSITKVVIILLRDMWKKFQILTPLLTLFQEPLQTNDDTYE